MPNILKRPMFRRGGSAAEGTGITSGLRQNYAEAGSAFPLIEARYKQMLPTQRDSIGNWGSPINIGYPINTMYDETSLFVSTDGKKAYFASNQLNGVGGWDIYEFLLYEEARPERVLFIKGDLYDENNQLLNDVELEVRNIRTNEVTVIKSDEGKDLEFGMCPEPNGISYCIRHLTPSSLGCTNTDSP